MKVSDIMSRRVVSVGQDEPVSAAARLLKQTNVGALPVCDDKRRLRGIVTDRDIVTLCDLSRSADCGMEAAAALTEISGNLRRK